MSWEALDPELCKVDKFVYYGACHLWKGDYVQCDDGQVGIVRNLLATGDSIQVVVKYQDETLHRLSVSHILRVWRNTNVDPERAANGFKLGLAVSNRCREKVLVWQQPIFTALAQEAIDRRLVPPLPREMFLELLYECAASERKVPKSMRVGYDWLIQYPRTDFYRSQVEKEILRLGAPGDTRRQDLPPPRPQPEIPANLIEEPVVADVDELPVKQQRESERPVLSRDPLASVLSVTLDQQGYSFDQIAPPLENYVNGVLGEGALQVENMLELAESDYDLSILHRVELPAITELLKNVTWVKNIRSKPVTMFGIS